MTTRDNGRSSLFKLFIKSICFSFFILLLLKIWNLTYWTFNKQTTRTMALPLCIPFKNRMQKIPRQKLENTLRHLKPPPFPTHKTYA